MVRIKLYVTEINNDDGYTIKNNWSVGYKNYTRAYTSDKEAAYNPTQQSFIPSVANITDTATIVDDAVTLTGGLTAAANLLGSRFNTQLTLNYLASEGIATVLDETELITLENKESVFHAGGTIYIKTQSTSAEGLPTSEVKPIDYGLKLEVKVNNIINDKYVDLTIKTKQDKIDWTDTRQVDGIPSFTKQSINTFAIIKNKATIFLGGLVNKNDA